MSASRPTLRELFEVHFGYVCQSLRRLGVPERDMEDVAHEAFVAVHRHLDRYDPERPVKPWLFAFAFNAASVYRRRAHVRRELIVTEPAEIAHDQPGPEAATVEAERRALLLEALDSLDADRRAVIILHDIDETPMPELAHALGIALNTGYSRLRLARQDLASAVRALAAKRGAMP